MKEEKNKSKAKIIIPLVIALIVIALIIVIINTTNKNMSKEQMLVIAKDYTGYETNQKTHIVEYNTEKLFEDLSENLASAEQEKENIFLLEHKIDKIEKDYFEFDMGQIAIKLYCSTDELAKLKNGELTKVIGELNNITKETRLNSGRSYDVTIFELKNCYVVTEEDLK